MRRGRQLRGIPVACRVSLADRGELWPRCGSGYWLPGYASEAVLVIGVEPDPALLWLAARRDRRAKVLPGSAEHLALEDASVDVVHSRFAYFWPPGCDAGLAERRGEFAELLRSAANAALGQADVTDAWWAARGARRVEVISRWQFDSRAHLEAVLRLEFRRQVADAWLAGPPDALGLTYGYVLFAVQGPSG